MKLSVTWQLSCFSILLFLFFCSNIFLPPLFPSRFSMCSFLFSLNTVVKRNHQLVYGQLRTLVLHVITRNLERSVFSFDTCTDMLQIFSRLLYDLAQHGACSFNTETPLPSFLFFFTLRLFHFVVYLSRLHRSAPFHDRVGEARSSN